MIINHSREKKIIKKKEKERASITIRESRLLQIYIEQTFVLRIYCFFQIKKNYSAIPSD